MERLRRQPRMSMSTRIRIWTRKRKRKRKRERERERERERKRKEKRNRKRMTKSNTSFTSIMTKMVPPRPVEIVEEFRLWLSPTHPQANHLYGTTGMAEDPFLALDHLQEV